MNSPAKRAERKTFGKYTLIGRLASGGMGDIYLARLQGVAGFEKIVVIKRILPHLAENDRYRHMLLDEARIAAQLNHPNVCQVHELDVADGEYYIAMEYLEGFTMAEILRRMAKLKARLDPRLVVTVITQAAEGLHAAHELRDRTGTPTNLVHRDVSPSNVFVTAAGPVKILDFGVAKTPDKLANTRTGAVKGKWAYMSPEQILRKPLDRRSDIFSLGVVTFEALTGTRLFRRRSEYEICRAITETDAPSVMESRPELPQELAAVVSRALSRSRSQRFESASEMSKWLTRSTARLGGPASLSEVAEFVGYHFAEELAIRREFVREVDAPNAVDRLAETSGPLPIAPTVHTDTSVNSGAVDIEFDTNSTRASDEQEAVPGPPTGKTASPGQTARTPAGSRRRKRRTRGRGDVEDEAVRSPLAHIELGPLPPSLAVRPSAWKTWVLVLAILAAGAGGAYAWVQSQTQPPPMAAEVDLQRGAIIREAPGQQAGDEATPDDPDDRTPVAVAGDAGAAAAANQPADAGAGERPTTTPDVSPRRKNPPPASDRASPKDPGSYSRLVRKRVPKIAQCYRTHAADIEPWPRFLFAITIDARGRVTAAQPVKPTGHKKSPLGQCLSGLIKTIDFGKGAGPITVEVPIGMTATPRKR